MKNSNLPLAIILKRTQNGYTFQALQQLLPKDDKNKKPKPGRKPAIKGLPNRLIKQIGLTNEQLAPHPTPAPQPQPHQQYEDEIHDNPPIYHHLQEEEQVSCDIDRQTELPKTPANWFDRNKINQIQKKSIKDFFCGSETKKPELYIKYRNFMIDAYRKNPNRYLSKIACRKILRGDVNIIMKIHSFLQKQGLINFSLSYDGNFTFKSNALTKPFEQTIKPQTTIKALPQANEQETQKQIDTDNMTLTVINKNFSRTYRACCNSCKLICGILWFANVSQEESTTQKNLCYECWSKKSQSQKQEYEKVDIVKKMQAHGRDGKNFPKNAWNIEQNIKLLEFMSNSHQEKSWRRLLNEFGGKRTIEDIVLQFLQFPISNVDMKKSKDLLENHLPKVDKMQIGPNNQDYKNILKSFFEQSIYNKKKKINGEHIDGVTRIEENKIQDEYKQNTSGLKEMLQLSIQKINTQIESLIVREKAIQDQTATYSSIVFYNRHKAIGSETQQLGKETNNYDNKSKSLRNEKKNESSQFLDDIEADANELSEHDQRYQQTRNFSF